MWSVPLPEDRRVLVLCPSILVGIWPGDNITAVSYCDVHQGSRFKGADYDLVVVVQIQYCTESMWRMVVGCGEYWVIDDEPRGGEVMNWFRVPVVRDGMTLKRFQRTYTDGYWDDSGWNETVMLKNPCVVSETRLKKPSIKLVPVAIDEVFNKRNAPVSLADASRKCFRDCPVAYARAKYMSVVLLVQWLIDRGQKRVVVLCQTLDVTVALKDYFNAVILWAAYGKSKRDGRINRWLRNGGVFVIDTKCGANVLSEMPMRVPVVVADIMWSGNNWWASESGRDVYVITPRNTIEANVIDWVIDQATPRESM
jgi:hypothetical protein